MGELREGRGEGRVSAGIGGARRKRRDCDRDGNVEGTAKFLWAETLDADARGEGERLHVKLRLEGWSQRSCVRCVFHMHLGNGRRKVSSGNPARTWKDADTFFAVRRSTPAITTQN